MSATPTNLLLGILLLLGVGCGQDLPETSSSNGEIHSSCLDIDGSDAPVINGDIRRDHVPDDVAGKIFCFQGRIQRITEGPTHSYLSLKGPANCVRARLPVDHFDVIGVGETVRFKATVKGAFFGCYDTVIVKQPSLVN